MVYSHPYLLCSENNIWQTREWLCFVANTKYNYRSFYFITFIHICVFASPFYFIEYLVDSLQSFLIPYHRILHVQSIAAVVDLRGTQNFLNFMQFFFFLKIWQNRMLTPPRPPPHPTGCSPSPTRNPRSVPEYYVSSRACWISHSSIWCYTFRQKYCNNTDLLYLSL